MLSFIQYMNNIIKRRFQNHNNSYGSMELIHSLCIVIICDDRYYNKAFGIEIAHTQIYHWLRWPSTFSKENVPPETLVEKGTNQLRNIDQTRKPECSQ